MFKSGPVILERNAYCHLLIVKVNDDFKVVHSRVLNTTSHYTQSAEHKSQCRMSKTLHTRNNSIYTYINILIIILYCCIHSYYIAYTSQWIRQNIILQNSVEMFHIASSRFRNICIYMYIRRFWCTNKYSSIIYLEILAETTYIRRAIPVSCNMYVCVCVLHSQRVCYLYGPRF